MAAESGEDAAPPLLGADERVAEPAGAAAGAEVVLQLGGELHRGPLPPRRLDVLDVPARPELPGEGLLPGEVVAAVGRDGLSNARCLFESNLGTTDNIVPTNYERYNSLVMILIHSCEAEVTSSRSHLDA